MARSLRDEIQQTRPFGSLETEVLLNLMRTADHVASALAAFLKPYELSESAYNVLRIVRGAGEDGLPSTQIGQRMVTRVPDVTRLVDRLAARGLVRRRRDEADKRVVRVYLEPPGAELLARLDAPAEELSLQLFAPLGERKLKSLRDLLTAIRNVERDASGLPGGDRSGV